MSDAISKAKQYATAALRCKWGDAQEWERASGDRAEGRFIAHCSPEFVLGIISELEALKAEQARQSDQCPYIVTGRDGTSHCRLAESGARQDGIDRELIGQAVSDFFSPLDNGDGTLAFDHCSSDDIDLLVDAMLTAAKG